MKKKSILLTIIVITLVLQLSIISCQSQLVPLAQTPTPQPTISIPSPAPSISTPISVPYPTSTPTTIPSPIVSGNETIIPGKIENSNKRVNIIVDHTNWDWYNSQPQQVIGSVATQKIFFSHASIGENIMQGFADLHSTNPLKYPLAQVSSDSNPPKTTMNGTVYEYPRGNPGWVTKVGSFETYVEHGWRFPKVGIVMNKLCAIDQDANWAAYCNSIAALEAKYPDTKFIYMTLPYYTSSGGADDILRNQFNQNMRDWIAGQSNKIFFDIADIEAWSPTAVHQTFTVSSITYEKLYSGFSSDGVHLNSEGGKRIAVGLYSLFGKITNLATSP